MAQPVHKINHSKVRIAIWANVRDNGDTSYRMTLEKAYYDKSEHEWRTSKNFTIAEFPDLFKALEEAQQWIEDQGDRPTQLDLPLPDQNHSLSA